MRDRGVSLISVIITVISIILIAAISIYSGFKTPDTAIFSSFVSTLDGIRIEVANVRAESFEKNRDMNKEFKKVNIENAPSDFISFPNNEHQIQGYVIDTSKLADKPKYGNDSVDGDTVEFGKDDVFVYDKNGTIYYAKGYLYDGEYFYTATVKK